MRKGNKDQPQIKEIAKDVFIKFKKVRDLHSQLYDKYQLYSKNGFKYVGKVLSANYQLVSTRNPHYPIFKYSMHDEATYLFPLHGQPLSCLLGNGSKMQQDGQVKRWIDKCGNFQACLFQALKKMLQVMEANSQEEILLECLRVYNGELQYCYDNWMKSSLFIVLNNPNELDNYYFSQEDLNKIKQLTLRKDKSININLVPSKMSTIFRIFLMVLHLGTHNLKERNYEYSEYKLHEEHLKLRLDYFCSRYNQKGLGDLVRKIISGQSMEMQEIWRICMPEINRNSKIRKTLTLSNTNIAKQKKRAHTQLSQFESETPIKHSHINRLNTSKYSHSSNKSFKDQDSNLQASKQTLYKSKLINDENQSRKKSTNKESTEGVKAKKNIKLARKQSKEAKDVKQYQLFSSLSKEKLNLKAILSQESEIPNNNCKILKYMGLEEYLPQTLYQEHVIEALSKTHIKSNWVKEIYENGSIYLGEMVQDKKQGKGLYLFNSSDFYFGDWAANFMEGYGTYIFTSGEVYQGQLKKGFKEGHGRCVYPDGKSYQGFWSKNNKIGLGKVKFPNQVIFIGLFKSNCLETQGLFLGPIGENGSPLWQNKGILEHYHWQKNTLLESKAKKEELVDRRSKLKHCKSEYYSQYLDDNGNKYEGEMVDGEKQGFGIYETLQEIYEGQWCEDKKHGSGQLFIKNSFKISGEWKNNMLVKYYFQEIEQPF